MSRVSRVRLITGQSIELSEPEWCVLQHQDGQYPGDIYHEGVEQAFPVSTPTGRFELLGAALTAYPLRSSAAARVPHVTVDLGGGFGSFDPAGLRRLATGLAGHALRLRGLAFELERIRAEAGR